jgi:ribosome biogenesis GTPase
VALGWDAALAAEPAPDPACLPARVILESKLKFRVWIPTPAGMVETWAEVSGKIRHRATTRRDFPAVGDWVWVQRRSAQGDARIDGILPRKTLLVRTAAGETTDPQVLAANVDVAFIATSLNRELNARRLERYVTLVRTGGAAPVILLTKCDAADPDFIAGALKDVTANCPGVPALVLSARAGQGLDGLQSYLSPGRTLVLLGSSGVGKSTLVNRLLGADAQAVREISGHEDRGRHTTTVRQMLRMPGGALLIDTPGIRELQLTGESGSGVDATFTEIDALAGQCRFRDCRHASEPGCAVLAAVARGELTAARVESFHKLTREAAHAARRTDKQVEAQHAQGAKRLTVAPKRKQQNEP